VRSSTSCERSEIGSPWKRSALLSARPTRRCARGSANRFRSGRCGDLPPRCARTCIRPVNLLVVSPSITSAITSVSWCSAGLLHRGPSRPARNLCRHVGAVPGHSLGQHTAGLGGQCPRPPAWRLCASGLCDSIEGHCTIISPLSGSPGPRRGAPAEAPSPAHAPAPVREPLGLSGTVASLRSIGHCRVA